MCQLVSNGLLELSAHKYLGRWRENGILERVLTALQEISVAWKLIDLTRLAVDGFFSAGRSGSEKVDYGYKGKGVTSTGASGDKRKEVIPLLKKISGWLKPIISRGKTPILEADKG